MNIINNYCAILLLIILFMVPFYCQAGTDKRLISNSLELTVEESQWLAANPTVSFTGDPNWLPYEAFTPEGNYIGIVASHLALISESTGLIFDLSPSDTWTESTQKAKEGVVDILSETDDSDLKSHLNFTQPYLSNPIVIAMRSKEHYVDSVSRIAHKRIALIKDYGYAAKIRRKYKDIDFITVDNIQDGLVSVSTGNVDALFCTLALCSYSIHELGLNNVKITGKTEFNTKLALGVQKDKPELLSILNKAIQNISQGQQQLILDEWIKHNYVEKVNYTLVIAISLAAFMLIGVFAYWNRRLSQEITLRSTIEKKLVVLNRNNERYRVLFYESTVGYAVNKLSTGDFVSVNQSFANITGYTLGELNALSYWDLTPKRYADDEEKQLKLLKETGRYGPYEKQYTHKEGRQVAVRLNGSVVIDPSGEKMILSVVEDISTFSEAREKLRLSSLALDNSSEGLVITDENNCVIAINPAFTNITGYSFDEVKGQNPSRLKSGRHDDIFFDEMWGKLNENGRWQGEIWDKRKNGEAFAKWLTINTIKNSDGVIDRYVALFSDITNRKLSEETIWKQANFDTLTGLPNRNMFYDRLEQAIIKSDKENSSLSLLLIDLDQFKEVNDTLGHDMGDLLLKEASKRISSSLRQSDTVARLGGDEFTIILSDVPNKLHVDAVAEKLIAELSRPYTLKSELVHISASVGITSFPDDATSMDVLIKNADQAMYEAKNKGRNCFSYFTQSLQDAAQKRLRLSNDLRVALSLNQFHIYFQPIVDLATNEICKAEALLRWKHPTRGMIQPLEFISLAEDIGVIIEIGDWVCHESNRLKQHWDAMFGVDIQISVNMSPVQFKVDREDFGKGWLMPKATGETKNKNIIIEITEGLLLNAEPQVLEKLYRLRDAGVEVAIDDFGTGYSSLAYLKRFDIDYLKIDQSFTKGLEDDPNDLALSEAIIVMAHKLGLKVIAEGVESVKQQEILANAGCDFAQGYLYSQPIPPEAFEQLLKEVFEVKSTSEVL